MVADLFGSFHDAQMACAALKEKKYPEESIMQFVQLTADDDLEARAAMFKDLGFTVREIGFLDEALQEGKILVCVDSLAEAQCARVKEILRKAGGLGAEPVSGRRKNPVAGAPSKKPGDPAPIRSAADNKPRRKRP